MMHGSNLEPHENFPSDEKLRERVEELSESVMMLLWVVFDFTFFFFLKRPLYCRLEIQIRPHGSPMLHFCTRLVSLPPVMRVSLPLFTHVSAIRHHQTRLLEAADFKDIFGGAQPERVRPHRASSSHH
jgi:hypothetical protein